MHYAHVIPTIQLIILTIKYFDETVRMLCMRQIHVVENSTKECLWDEFEINKILIFTNTDENTTGFELWTISKTTLQLDVVIILAIQTYKNIVYKCIKGKCTLSIEFQQKNMKFEPTPTPIEQRTVTTWKHVCI